MANFQPAPNVIQATMHYMIDGQKVQNSYYFLKSTGVLAADIQKIANDMVNNFWALHLRNDTGANAQLLDCTATDMSTNTGIQRVVVPASNTAIGGFNSSCVPNNVALVVTSKTAERSRNGRGRQYIPGTPLAQLAGTIRVTNQHLANVLASYTSLFTIASGAVTSLVVLSRVLNGIRRPTAVPINVTSFLGDVALDSQRRRLEGRGT